MGQACSDGLRRHPTAHDGPHPGYRRERPADHPPALGSRRRSVVVNSLRQSNQQQGPSLQAWGRFDNLFHHESGAGENRLSGGVEGLLLERYRRLGESFLDGLTGAFAVALTDPERDLIALARDGMGNGYLAYALVDGRPVAGRNDAELATATGNSGNLSSLRLAEFFGFEELSGPQTFFAGVRALLPGEMLIWEAGRMRRRPLRRPRLDLALERPRWEDYVEELAQLLDASVRRALAGTDRVAVLMSGGLDSTPIAALAARQLGKVTALTWRVSDPRGDERDLVRRMAEHTGIDVEWIDCDDALPFSDLATWPIHPATPEQTAFRWFHQRSYARAAELGHSVVLSGFCGDALYVDARNWAWDLLQAEGPGRTIDRLRILAAEIGWRRTVRTHIFGPLLPRRRTLRRLPAAYLTASAKRQLESRSRWPADVESARRPRQAARVLALLDAHGAHVERFYTEAFDLDQRTPLRDFDLAQFLLAVPDHLLQQGTETRPILRRAVRGLIPDAVRLRRGKAAFFDVLERGLATERMSWARELLLAPEGLWRRFIEESAVQSWLTATPADGESQIGYLHAIYSELWRRQRAGLSALVAASGGEK